MGRPPKKIDASVPTRDMPWEEAIQTVLRNADGALHYSDIAERIAAGGFRRSLGATPAQTVSSYLSTSIRDNNESPYLRIGRGEYSLKEKTEENANVAIRTEIPVEPEQESGALRAFGMFWQRDLVLWLGKPHLLGRQSAGTTDVNFASQIGVYLLHDRERVIYIGRASDTLFARLKAHTTDRLGGRWDRFSWFGLRSVANDGELSDKQIPWSQEVVIETMEAVLIESLEPPLNRRRGDNFSAAEYVQAADPKIEKAKQRAILAELSKTAGLE